jgi:hypothetical protein
VLLEECCGSVEASVMEERLAAVAAYLEGYLDGMGPRVITGRSD